MKKRKQKTMAPRDAKTLDEVCGLRRDNKTFGGYWILIDGLSVTVAKQNPKERATFMTTIPRATFNRMIDWYMRPQKVRTNEEA